MADDSVEIERSGWRGKLKGRDAFPYLIIIVLLGGVGGLVKYNLGSWGEPFNIESFVKQHHSAMDQQHNSYVNGVSELTYVMSVCLNQSRQKECESLRIHMPDSLYRKLNNAQQP